ncbi:MAG: hypothetical protein MI919_40860, partial [Holophagales bacterium]|nr:hypothetical protein [Holophagales bacterium]
ILAEEAPSLEPIADPAPAAVATFGVDQAGLPQTALAGQEEVQSTAAGCSAYASCWDGTSRSCSTTVSGATCAGVDSNCSAQRGYARCGTTYSYCPACPSSGGCSFEGANCSSSAFCASKCQLICDTEGGFCINGKCTCEIF